MIYIDYKDIGLRIKDTRLNHGLTQRKLGELLNVSNVTISKYETADVKVPLEMLLNICAVLKIGLDDLVKINKTTEWGK